MKARKVIHDSVMKKANLAVEEALFEHKRKNVPYVILDPTDDIIYEVYSDGSRIPLKKRDVNYVERVLNS